MCNKSTGSNFSLGKFKLGLDARRNLWAVIFLAVPVLYFLVAFILPIIKAFQFSLMEYNTLGGARQYVAFLNYRNLFKSNTFYRALKNTIIFAVVRTPISVVLGLGLAVMLASIKRLQGFFRTLFFTPHVTSFVAIAWVWRFMYLPNFGLINQVLMDLGFSRKNFLGDPKLALYSIIAVTVWQSVGYYTLLFLTGLQQIPEVYYEAAKIDGASGWQTFRNITLPLLNRTIVLITTLCLISSLQSFVMVRTLGDGSGGPLRSTLTLPLLIYQEAFTHLRLGTGSAVSFVFFVMILVVTLAQMRLLRRDFEY